MNTIMITGSSGKATLVKGSHNMKMNLTTEFIKNIKVI